jgi:hypothetical protein
MATNAEERTVAEVIPKELQERARQIVNEAFQLLADQTRRLAEDVSEFDEHRKDVKRRIDRGARRTDGRIV